MEKCKLEVHVLKAIEKEEQWIVDAANSGRYPGEVIYEVGTAMKLASAAIEEFVSKCDGDVPIDELVALMEEGREKYRADACDNDGYGSSTFAGLIRAVQALQVTKNVVGDLSDQA